MSKEAHEAEAEGNGREFNGSVKATFWEKRPFEESGGRDALKIQDKKSGLGFLNPAESRRARVGKEPRHGWSR